MNQMQGAYSGVILVNTVGLVAFRDPFGIRPLVLGHRKSNKGVDEWCVASESVAFEPLGFDLLRDVNPGECIIMDSSGGLESRQLLPGKLHPCLFEYIYLARQDSTINGVNVYDFQLLAGPLRSPWAYPIAKDL
jgi:amidophosphoribosyltransferase